MATVRSELDESRMFLLHPHHSNAGSQAERLDHLAHALPQDGTRILESTARALPGIPLFLAGSLADPLVLLDQLVFASALGRDHFVAA
jgi:hypothetical protein